ncbi:MAG: hypothetical protein R2795_19315 [Saprospiraceae bacterium]
MELTTTNGNFTFQNIAAGDYWLKVMGLGFDDYFGTPFAVSDKESKTLPVVRVGRNVTTLEAVEVVARKPLLEQQAGKLVVNVADNITGQGGSVTDLLKKSPAW